MTVGCKLVCCNSKPFNKAVLYSLVLKPSCSEDNDALHLKMLGRKGGEKGRKWRLKTEGKRETRGKEKRD